jgi:hypothetical protein
MYKKKKNKIKIEGKTEEDNTTGGQSGFIIE